MPKSLISTVDAFFQISESVQIELGLVDFPFRGRSQFMPF